MKKIFLLILLIPNMVLASTVYTKYEPFILNTSEYLEETDILKREEVKLYNTYKEEIIEVARKIKTYDISIRPYEDCCTVFVPEHPVIKPTTEETIKQEEKCNLDDLIEEATNNIKVIKLNDTVKYSVFDDEDDEF